MSTLFQILDVPPDTWDLMPAETAPPLLNLEQGNREVHPANYFLAALWTEGAVALVTRGVADVDVL